MIGPMADYSTNRKAEGGWVDGWPGAIAKLPKGPNGRLLCRRCGVEVPPGRRRTFCSVECVDEWKMRTQPGHMRALVFRRDNGICQLCRVDCFAGKPANHRRARGTGHLWAADHIVPVVEGGGECGLDNVRTLCIACHRSVTADLRKRLAQNRRLARDLPLFAEEGATQAKDLQTASMITRDLHDSQRTR